MGRTVYSGEACLHYLEQYADQQKLVVGLILGQSTQSRETVIHLARTPEEKTDDTTSNVSSDTQNSDGSWCSLLAVSEAWVADHAKHVTRMLPGGMFVQGIFITSAEDIFENPGLLNKVKSILTHTYKCLDINAYMFGNCPASEERLVLHMSTSTKVLSCKSVLVNKGNKETVVQSVDFRFLPKINQWQRLDCCYEFDEFYPVIVKNNGISVKHQFKQILQSTYKTIQSSVMFFDGELRDVLEPLEQLTKRKKTKSGSKAAPVDPPKSMHVSLYVPFESQHPDAVEYIECDGSIHFSGVVSSRVFLYPKATVGEAKTAVKQDILRSLASRFTMHCDALIDDNLLPEEKVCFNEPPRRVLVPLRAGGAASGAAELYLCDYLFPGEAPAEALVSVRELLDVQLTENDVVSDLETPADTAEFDALDRDASSEELCASPQEASQFMYITGIGFALLVLIVSILIHYYQDIVKFFS